MKNRRFKRLTSIFIALAMLAGIAPWSSIETSASYTGTFQFNADGKFTVMQLTDIQDNADVDNRIISVITKSIARYHPDLVVLTGDNISGTISKSAFQSSVNEFLAPLLATDTKFAVTFGNHDNDKIALIADPGTLTEQYAYYKSHGGSDFVDHDVTALNGVGSGVIPIYANGQTSGTPAYQIYLMDSNDTASSGSYDCPYTDQVDYYIQRSQTYPDVPSLWFQHIVVPDIYTRCLTSSGSGTSYTGNGTPFSGSSWYIDPNRINYTRSSSSVIPDIYREGPCPANQSVYEAAAHRSSAAYGSKTLYEAWRDYGNLKGAYFGHDHLNEFTCMTTDGIDLGYGDSTGLVFGYQDDDPGVSIYQLDIDGTYTNEYSAESDLSKTMVSYNANGGTGDMANQLIASGNSAALRENTFIKPGYYFAGWSTTPAGGVMYTDKANFTAGSSDVILYAKWNASIFNITFDANGGTGGTGPVAMQAGTALTAPSVSRTGYTLTGWLPALPAAVPEADTVYTAQWSINSYLITFDANSGEGGTSVSMQFGASLEAPDVTRTGFTFTGWQPEVPLTVGAADAVYTAQWMVNRYTMTFDANGGQGGTVINSDFGTPIVLPAVSREGYTFSGWQPSVPGTVPAEDMTFTAQWSLNKYSLTFDANGGSGGTVIALDYGAVISPPAVTKEGYTFTGWSPEIPLTVEAADAVYTAQWTANKYTIIFDANGGSGGVSELLEYGSVLEIPEVTREGYTLTGWQPSVPGTVPAQNITYTAQWAVNQYTVVFDVNGGTGAAPLSQIGPEGTAVLLPAQGALSRLNYVFKGWATTPDASVGLTSFVISKSNATLYAVWYSLPASVSVKAGSTTVIETSDNLIYGLRQGLKQADFESGYVQVKGNGRLVCTSKNGIMGTGSKVELVDNSTNEVVATYYVVIFGDVNGDGVAGGIDAGIIVNVENYILFWDSIADAAFIAAADVNGDGSVNGIDSGIIVNAENYITVIDQVTGLPA